MTTLHTACRPCHVRLTAIAVLLAVTGLATAEPPPGHPSAEQAGRLLGLPEALPAARLPYSGIVLRAMDANAFTYIEVQEKTQDGEVSRWIAAPLIAVSPGARIGYDDGRLMAGFYSRKLKLSFESITFVNRVAVLAPAPDVRPARPLQQGNRAP